MPVSMESSPFKADNGRHDCNLHLGQSLIFVWISTFGASDFTSDLQTALNTYSMHFAGCSCISDLRLLFRALTLRKLPTDMEQKLCMP